MIRNKNVYYYFFSLLISWYFCGCKSSTPTEVIKLDSASDREFGEIIIPNIDNLIVENRIGGIILNGLHSKDTIQYYLYKTIRAETILKAEAQFGEIILESNKVNNSLECFISSPDSTAYYEYYCSLSLDLSEKICCSVNSPNRGVFTNFLDTTLTVFNSTGNIEVLKHTGSCDIKTSLGDIFIELILPINGFCRGYSASGNIKLEILSNASATIHAKTEEGTIRLYNLAISDLEESDGLLSGKLGSGVGDIYLETKDGDIEIVGFN